MGSTPLVIACSSSSFTLVSSPLGSSSSGRVSVYSGLRAEPEYMGSTPPLDVVASVVGNSVLCAVLVDVSFFGSNSELGLLPLPRAQVSIFSSWSLPGEECTPADVCTCITAAK